MIYPILQIADKTEIQKMTLVDPNCVDCGMNTHEIGEAAFMLNDWIWEKIGKPPGSICVGCIEVRLGRQLSFNDFPGDIPLNGLTSDTVVSNYLQNVYGGWRSERLLNRMKPAKG